MTERDRLAADLHDEWDKYRVCEPSEPGSPCEECTESADRLIALGWTKVPNPPVMVTDPGAAQMAEWLAAWQRSEGQGSNSIQAADLRGLGTDTAWAEGHRRGDALDEERLARALTTVQATGVLAYDSPDPHPAAAAIAKAYREDTDDRA